MWPWVSCVAAGKLCGRGQAAWSWVSYTAGELYAAGELCGSGELCGGRQLCGGGVFG